MGAQAVRLSNLDIDNALRDRQFEILFQPIYDLSNGALARMESFVRWRHPSLGVLPPGAFISFFETQGRMSELTRYVLDQALNAYLEWRGPYAPGFSINLALSDLTDDAFAGHLTDVLAEANFPAEFLTLECPMPSVEFDHDLAKERFKALSDTGTRLAIEVRGRANELLKSLDPFPFAEVKSGGAAILRFARTVRGPGLSAISELVDLANQHNAAITAVGVEDQSSLTALKGLGFAAAQGNYIGKVGALGQFTPSRVNDVRDHLGLTALSKTDLAALFRTNGPGSDFDDAGAGATPSETSSEVSSPESANSPDGESKNAPAKKAVKRRAPTRKTVRKRRTPASDTTSSPETIAEAPSEAPSTETKTTSSVAADAGSAAETSARRPTRKQTPSKVAIARARKKILENAEKTVSAETPAVEKPLTPADLTSETAGTESAASPQSMQERLHQEFEAFSDEESQFSIQEANNLPAATTEDIEDNAKPVDGEETPQPTSERMTTSTTADKTPEELPSNDRSDDEERAGEAFGDTAKPSDEDGSVKEGMSANSQTSEEEDPADANDGSETTSDGVVDDAGATALDDTVTDAQDEKPQGSTTDPDSAPPLASSVAAEEPQTGAQSPDRSTDQQTEDELSPEGAHPASASDDGTGEDQPEAPPTSSPTNVTIDDVVAASLKRATAQQVSEEPPQADTIDANNPADSEDASIRDGNDPSVDDELAQVADDVSDENTADEETSLPANTGKSNLESDQSSLDPVLTGNPTPRIAPTPNANNSVAQTEASAETTPTDQEPADSLEDRAEPQQAFQRAHLNVGPATAKFVPSLRVGEAAGREPMAPPVPAAPPAIDPALAVFDPMIAEDSLGVASAVDAEPSQDSPPIPSFDFDSPHPVFDEAAPLAPNAPQGDGALHREQTPTTSHEADGDNERPISAEEFSERMFGDLASADDEDFDDGAPRADPHEDLAHDIEAVSSAAVVASPRVEKNFLKRKVRWTRHFTRWPTHFWPRWVRRTWERSAAPSSAGDEENSQSENSAA